MTTRYMTTGTAARALGLTVVTLRRMCERGAVPGAYNFCGCTAGTIRRAYDAGADLEAVTVEVTGRTRGEWWAVWRGRQGSE